MGAAYLLSAVGCAVSEPPPALHPAFSITMPDLEEVLAAVEAHSAARIRARPQVFLELMTEMLTAPQAWHVLVDKEHAPGERVRA